MSDIFFIFSWSEQASSFCDRFCCGSSLRSQILFYVTHIPNTCRKSKTFKPKKNIPEGTKQYQLKQYAEATLGSGNLRLAVTLPEGEDLNEWLAVNSTLVVVLCVDFFLCVSSYGFWFCFLAFPCCSRIRSYRALSRQTPTKIGSLLGYSN